MDNELQRLIKFVIFIFVIQVAELLRNIKY